MRKVAQQCLVLSFLVGGAAAFTAKSGAAVNMLHRQDGGMPQSRRALLKSSVFAVGTLAASAANAAVLTPVPRLISSPSTLPNRTPSEMQYEMFKNGMLLEDDEDYAAACIQ
eukprot:5397-Heterococcus_DN1.PRE.1